MNVSIGNHDGIAARAIFRTLSEARHSLCERPSRMDPNWEGISSVQFQRSYLASKDLRRLDSLGRISRVNHQLRLIHDLLVVVVGMVGHDRSEERRVGKEC